MGGNRDGLPRGAFWKELALTLLQVSNTLATKFDAIVGPKINYILCRYP